VTSTEPARVIEVLGRIYAEPTRRAA
jgi:hypothetical protein